MSDHHQIIACHRGFIMTAKTAKSEPSRAGVLALAGIARSNKQKSAWTEDLWVRNA
jgi:hypothetical protein